MKRYFIVFFKGQEFLDIREDSPDPLELRRWMHIYGSSLDDACQFNGIDRKAIEIYIPY